MSIRDSFVIFSAAAALLSCSSPERRPEKRPEIKPEIKPEKNPEQWADKMQGLSVTLSDLLPYVASKAKFDEPSHFAQIESDTRALGGLARDLKNTHAPNADPMMKIMNGMMSADVDRALQSLQSGNRDYARQILKETTSYCFQCHAQTPLTPGGTAKSLPSGFNLNMDVASLGLVDRAGLFAATRQFDKALASYREALADPKFAQANALDWESAARAALMIIVQVKNDPSEATLFVTKLERQSNLPLATKKSIGSWKKTAGSWTAERENEKKNGRSEPAEELKKAQALVDFARKHQEFPLDHSQDINYFRAGSLVHDYLQNSQNLPKRTAQDLGGARALYLAGLVSEATRDLNFWTLHESYYEQCIRWLPHSAQAEECFDRLKDSVTLGYSGSGGVNVPADVTSRLESFRVLADADPKTDNSENRSESR